MQSILKSPRQQQKRATGYWWHAPHYGYLAGLLLIGALLLLKYIDSYLAAAPYFAVAPFGLVSIAVALTWGLGPALFSLVIGLVAVGTLIVPGTFTQDLWQDIAVVGPFVVIDILIVLLAIQISAINHKLVMANHQLQKASQFKDYFITRASHELRSPLTTIRGQSQFALRRLDRAKGVPLDPVILQKHFTRIEARTIDMQSLLEDMLTLSSIYEGKMTMRISSCNLSELCHEIVEDQQISSGRSIELQVPVEPVFVDVDNVRLSEVFSNLVSNAIKYSASNSIILISIQRELDSVLVQVYNESSFLSKEERQRIFEPFYRTPDAEASKPGWGLGLAISKEIVERHGGHIWAESSTKGTTFFVRLPLKSVLN